MELNKHSAHTFNKEPCSFSNVISIVLRQHSGECSAHYASNDARQMALEKADGLWFGSYGSKPPGAKLVKLRFEISRTSLVKVLH
ncbi:hypothetical protein TNCV_3147261 [Trichonephila clavipes]|nr:hypothetical protein TNCV_3147261 [Trichonephila clavipes]